MPRPFDPRARQREIANARADGLAPRNMLPKMLPGAVFIVKDESINLPTPTSGVRKLHDTRRVIIVSSKVMNQAMRPNTILVVPCSGSHTTVGPQDLALPDGEPAFTAERATALASLVQPILKSDLGTFVDMLEPTTLANLHARICTNLGVVLSRSTALPAFTTPVSQGVAARAVEATVPAGSSELAVEEKES